MFASSIIDPHVYIFKIHTQTECKVKVKLPIGPYFMCLDRVEQCPSAVYFGWIYVMP